MATSRIKNGQVQTLRNGRWVNVSRPPAGRSSSRGYSSSRRRADNAYYQSLYNSAVLRDLQKSSRSSGSSSSAPAPAPAQSAASPAAPVTPDAESVIQKIVEERIADNQAQLDEYQEMISGLEARLAAANKLAELQIGNYRVSVNGEGQPNAIRDPLEDLLIKKTVKSGTVQRKIPSSSLQRLAIANAGAGLNLAL